MKRPGRNRAGSRVGAVALSGILALGIAGGAFGYWMGTGAGTATTVLESPEQLTLSPGTPEAQATPGHDSSVVIVATNPNPYFAHIGSLVLDEHDGPAFAVDSGHSGCDPSVLGFAPQDNGGIGWRVPPRVAAVDGTLTISMAGALSMGDDAASACQGASFTVHLEAGA